MANLKVHQEVREAAPAANHKAHQARVKSHQVDLLKVDHLREHHLRVLQLKWVLLQVAQRKAALVPHKVNPHLRAGKALQRKAAHQHLAPQLIMVLLQVAQRKAALVPHRANPHLRVDQARQPKAVLLKVVQARQPKVVPLVNLNHQVEVRVDQSHPVALLKAIPVEV